MHTYWRITVKHIFVLFMLGLVSISTRASETITILSPYSASHSGTPAMFQIINQANSQQKDYKFILDFRPGGEQIIAVNALKEQPSNRLAIIAPKFVEHVRAGRLNQSDYVPVHALGDACWAVITNVGNSQQGVASLRDIKEITVGGVGVGNAAHMTALELADRYNFKVRYIPFKSNFDALVLLVSDQSINLVLERVNSYLQYREKNPRVTVLGVSCPNRHPDLPDVPTLAEQKLSVPYVFNITVAHINMPDSKRRRLGQILDSATNTVGAKEIFRLSDMTPPIFSKQKVTDYYQARFEFMNHLLQKHESELKNN
jgi:tripartite-type tricarboxylate transporter receptor subunit TctC